MKKIIIIGITLLLFSCANFPGLGSGFSASTILRDTSYIVTLPESGNLVIVGVSGRQSSEANELRIAKEDAARKASMFHRVFGTSVEW